MSRLDDIVTFLSSIRYSPDFTTITGVDIGHSIDYHTITDIILTTGSTSKIFVENPEVINTDNLRGTKTIMYDINLESDTEENFNSLSDNLLKRIYDFNNRSTLYDITTDWSDDFDANAIGDAPAGWTAIADGVSTLTIQAYLTHPKCAELDLNSLVAGDITMTKAVTGGKDLYTISFDMAFLNSADAQVVGLDENETYGDSKGITTGTTAWKSYTIVYDIAADTYEIWTDGVAGGDVALGGITIGYVMAYLLTGAAVDDGIMYLDNVVARYGAIITRPTKMIKIEQLNYGQEEYNKLIPKWQAKYRFAITYTL